MKIKIILIVFMLIIGSSFLFTILSSKTTTNNNKVFFVNSFIKAAADPQILPGKIAKEYFIINSGKDKQAKDQLILAEINMLRVRIGKAYPKDFVVMQYHDLPKLEQVLTLPPDSLDNTFVVKQHGKKILNVLMNETKIISLYP